MLRCGFLSRHWERKPLPCSNRKSNEMQMTRLPWMMLVWISLFRNLTFDQSPVGSLATGRVAEERSDPAHFTRISPVDQPLAPSLWLPVQEIGRRCLRHLHSPWYYWHFSWKLSHTGPVRRGAGWRFSRLLCSKWDPDGSLIRRMRPIGWMLHIMSKAVRLAAATASPESSPVG